MSEKRVIEGTVHLWCDHCQSQYLDDGEIAGDQDGPTDTGWFRGLDGSRVRVTVEVLDAVPDRLGAFVAGLPDAPPLAEAKFDENDLIALSDAMEKGE